MSAFCDRLVTAPLPYTHTDLLFCCVPLCSLTHRTLRREENSALSLSVSPSVTQVRGFFPLTFRVSSASGLFFTLVCSTYLLTSRVLVNVGFVQTWCLVECFFFLNRQLPLTSFFTSRTECLTLSCCISLNKKGSSGIKLYYKLISYTHTHTLSPSLCRSSEFLYFLNLLLVRSSGIKKLYYKLIRYTHTHTLSLSLPLSAGHQSIFFFKTVSWF